MSESESDEEEETNQYFARYEYKTWDWLTALNSTQIKGLSKYLAKTKEEKKREK